MKIRRIFRAIVSVFFVTAIFMATIINAQAQQKKVRIFTMMGPWSSVVFVADHKGFLKEEGLDADVRLFSSGAEAVEGFLAGRADFVQAGQIPAAKLWANPEIVGVCPVESGYKDNIIVASKEIKSPADLKGKIIGVRPGTGGDQLLRGVLKKAGISLNEVTIKPLNPTEGVAALDRGDIVAHAVWEPYGQQSLDISGDKVHIMLNSKDYFTALMMISSTKKFVKDNPQETEAVVRAFHKAAQFIQNNFDESVIVCNKAMKTDSPVTGKIMKIVSYGVAMTPELKDAMQVAWDFNKELGVIKGEIDWKTMFDPSFLRKVDPKLVSADFK